jgi:hypothetical protein
VNDELGRMWKEAIADYCIPEYRHGTSPAVVHSGVPNLEEKFHLSQVSHMYPGVPGSNTIWSKHARMS